MIVFCKIVTQLCLQVEILMHCAAVVLSFMPVFLVIYTKVMCREGAGRSSCSRINPYLDPYMHFVM